MSKDIHNETNQYLTFRLAGEQYAIRVTSIREVLELPALTRVPRMPEYMCGVINLRGSVVPVVDLKKRFGLYGKGDCDPSNIVVTEIMDGDGKDLLTIGIFCDGVQEVLTFEENELEPPPRIGVPLDTDFLIGMGKKGEDFVLLLNIDRVLSAGELSTLKSSAEILETDNAAVESDSKQAEGSKVSATKTVV